MLVELMNLSSTVTIATPAHVTVSDIHITIKWQGFSLIYVIFDEYEEVVTSNVFEANNALMRGLANPRPTRCEFPTRAYSSGQ